MNKVELRRQLQSCLRSLSQKQREAKSRKACRNLASTEQFQAASTVMMYLSLPHEVDTAEIILQAWQMGKTVAVPKVSWQQRHMLPVAINSLETGFTTGVGGFRNPTAGTPVAFEEIDLVVSPALGFDRHGNRLGRGGAFYDRLFANSELTASRCGLAFAEQVVDSVPVAEHDEPIHFLVTDEGIISCNQKKGA
jgi:5-formyltetrahydrofolate cyclo-ligase